MRLFSILVIATSVLSVLGAAGLHPLENRTLTSRPATLGAFDHRAERGRNDSSRAMGFRRTMIEMTRELDDPAS